MVANLFQPFSSFCFRSCEWRRLILLSFISKSTLASSAVGSFPVPHREVLCQGASGSGLPAAPHI
jgi:hypothetical protein